jgi:hypothetical protein
MAGNAVKPERISRYAVSQLLRRIRFGSLRFYLALLIVAVALHLINSVVDRLWLVEVVPDKDLALEFQKRQVDIWAEMNKLLITLATAMAGALGAFMLNRDKTSPLSAEQMRRAAASWIFCAFSLYFGYLSYSEATLILSHGVFNSYTPRLWWPMEAQFWTFLISVILFADFIYGSIQDKHKVQP